MRRYQTGDAGRAAKAANSGVALGKLRRVYAEWEREEFEAIYVIEAVGEYLRTLK